MGRPRRRVVVDCGFVRRNIFRLFISKTQLAAINKNYISFMLSIRSWAWQSGMLSFGSAQHTISYCLLLCNIN